MLQRGLKYFFTCFFAIGVTVVGQATAQDGFPEPTNNPDQLFYLQRTHNKNTIVYELNKKNGVLDTKEPIHVFWIRYEENAQRQELSYIQRKFAYGIQCKKLKENHYRVTLNSYDKFPMELIKDADGVYKIFVTANGKQIHLNRIFIKINGGPMWSPDIEYFELKGKDTQSGIAVAEKMKVLKTETSKTN